MLLGVQTSVVVFSGSLTREENQSTKWGRGDVEIKGQRFGNVAVTHDAL